MPSTSDATAGRSTACSTASKTRSSRKAEVGRYTRLRWTAMWTINGNLGPRSRSGVDASGWLWEIARDGEARRVLVEISGSALASTESSLPGETAAAIRTEGHTEVLKVLRLDQPPQVIACGTMGCRHVNAAELS